MTGAHAAVTRELLVRYLDAVTPAVLHHAKRFTYAEAYAGPPPDGEPAVVAALRVFGEFTDLLPGRRLDVLLVDADPALRSAAERAVADLDSPAGLRLATADGPLPDALAGAVKAPLVVYLDALGGPGPDDDTLDALATGPQTDLLMALDRGAPRREALTAGGFRAVVHVELVDAAGLARELYFASTAARNLDRFKDALWAVDEFAGVRYRDPVDPDRAPLDISLRPHLGPLRRALLARLRAGGPSDVAALREYARTHTIYRAADATRALTALLSAAAVRREPDRGRLAADTVIHLP